MRFVDDDGVVHEVKRDGDLVRGPYDCLQLVFDLPEDFGEVVTVQDAIPECDLNVMVRRWSQGVPGPEFVPGQYGDVTGVRDIADVRSRLGEMSDLFMKVPAEVREKFGNDALAFFEAVGDPSRVGELRELGLIAQEEPPAPPPVVEPTA